MEDLNHYYEILGVRPDATEEEIKQAYRDLVKVWHPDRFIHDPPLQDKANKKLSEINEAYQKIQDYLNDPYRYRESHKRDSEQSSTSEKASGENATQSPESEDSSKPYEGQDTKSDYGNYSNSQTKEEPPHYYSMQPKDQPRLFKPSFIIFPIVAISLILIFLFVFTGRKGKLHGDVIFITKPSYVAGELIVEGGEHRIKEMDIFLLKYDAKLIATNEQLRNDCKLRLDKADKDLKDEGEDLIKSWPPQAPFPQFILDGRTDRYFKKVENMVKDCVNENMTNIFPYIVQQTKTNDMGHYEFSGVPYGKYIVYSHLEALWWFFPIEINQKETRVDIADKHPFNIQQ